ncbi:MAG TPA: sulfatase [Chitinophagaceae bacterium]|nr:sulfatase [Chitinophagaceae bacterium]
MSKKWKMFLGILILLFSCHGIHAQDISKQLPNVIVFLVDDMGWEDSSVPFWDSVVAQNNEFDTPNMVRLAAKSMKFTQAYANSICTPSRVSLMTGMNAAHHRVTNWTMYKNKAVDPPDSLLEIPDWNVNGLSPVPNVPNTVYATTLFQVLKRQGYYTIHCGKAHFGAYQTPGANPINLGADMNIAGSAAGNPASYLGMKDYGNVQGEFRLRAIKGLKDYWNTPTFLSKALTLEAMKAMDTAQMKEKPFFLYLAHYAVHLPYNADSRYIQKYLNEGLSKSEAAYATLVEGMDASLGTIMDYLKKEGIAKNTIIIFMSDNGGFSHAPRAGKQNTQNYPLRGGKGSLYEGGIREPMMVYWPGVTQPGSVANQYVSVWDFMPTILDMVGIEEYKTVQQMDGKSFVPVLKNPDYKDSNRVLIWNFPNNWGNGLKGQGHAFVSAVRKGSWKLIYFEKEGIVELYNLKKDIKEQHNLLFKFPEKAEEMAHLLTEKLKKANAQRPIVKTTGEEIPWPDEVVK